uniref:Uncharacterized protein n=1 Tax=Lutzomyia longipalpis TaxID=7200 RepID=A0A1B0CW96_LUTLO
MNGSMNGVDGGRAANRICYTLDQMKSIGDLPASRRVPQCASIDRGFYIPWKSAPSQLSRKNDTKPPGRGREARDREFREPREGVKERPERRIGSGRIVERDVQWACEGGGNSGAPLGYRNGGPLQTFDGRRKRYDDPHPTDWLERRGLGARNPPSMFDKMRSHNGGAIRRMQQQYEGEPEWLHAGPTSKFDCVELHGFDETINEEEAKDHDPSVSSSTPVKDPPHRRRESNAGIKADNLSFDKFFRAEGDVPAVEPDGATSRFSQWFPKAVPFYPRNEVSKNVKEFLQMANLGASGGEKRSDKLMSVNDIEASLRDNKMSGKEPKGGDGQQEMNEGSSNVEMDVFRKFVANMPNEQLGAKAAVPPFFVDDRNTAKLFNMGSMRWGRPTLATYVELLQKIINYGATQMNRHELLNSRDGQRYFQALMRGEMSVYNLLHAMRNLRPGREQELIIAVLFAFNQATQIFHMTPPSFVPQQPPLAFPRNPFDPMSGAHTMFPPSFGQNQGGGSPAKPQQQRFPSARELHLHTQSIMQNALMRKKMEEQLENFAKTPYGGAIDGQGASTGGRPSQSTHPLHMQFPFGFTPTSVLSKMVTTDKDAGAVPPKNDSSEASSI